MTLTRDSRNSTNATIRISPNFLRALRVLCGNKSSSLLRWKQYKWKPKSKSEEVFTTKEIPRAPRVSPRSRKRVAIQQTQRPESLRISPSRSSRLCGKKSSSLLPSMGFGNNTNDSASNDTSLNSIRFCVSPMGVEAGDTHW